MARRVRYEVSDETFRQPVTADEVDRYLAAQARPLLGKTQLRHFLYRVRVTISTLEASTKQLKHDVDKANEHRSRAGVPTTLSPMDAVRFASADEIGTIVGHLNSSMLNALSDHVSTARALREALSADLAKVRAAAHQMTTRTDFPAHVRAEFVRLLNELPADPDPVPVPKALELAQLSGVLDVDDATAGPALPDPGGAPTGPGHPALRDHRTTDQIPYYTAPDWQPDPS